MWFTLFQYAWRPKTLNIGKGGFAMMYRKWITATSLLTGFAVAIGFGTANSARADDPKCEPEKIATKYPSLKGKTIKVATDAESPPYSFRDAKDFNNIIGVDVDMARAA